MKFGPSNYASTVKTLLGKEMNLRFVGYPAFSETEGNSAGMLGGYSLAPRTSHVGRSSFIVDKVEFCETNSLSCKAVFAGKKP